MIGLKKPSKLGSLIMSWENGDRSCSQKLSSGTKLSATRKLCNYLNTWFKWRVCMAVSIVNWGKQLILFRGNCHHKKSSYLILFFFYDASVCFECIINTTLKITFIWCCPTLCRYGWYGMSYEMSSSGIVRSVSHIPASNTHVKCDILNSIISALSDGKLRAVHWAETFFFS